MQSRSPTRHSALSTRHSPARRAFTLVELLVVIAIIALLIAILLPALRKAQTAARKTQCASNIHQVAMAMIDYTYDWNGALPYRYTPSTAYFNVFAGWRDRLRGTGYYTYYPPPGYYLTFKVYLATNNPVWVCPLLEAENPFSPWYQDLGTELTGSYAMNRVISPDWRTDANNVPSMPIPVVRLSKVKPTVPLLADGRPYQYPSGLWTFNDWSAHCFDGNWYTPQSPGTIRFPPWPINVSDTLLPSNTPPGPIFGVVTTRHGGGFNAAFPDGHVESLQQTTPEMFRYP